MTVALMTVFCVLTFRQALLALSLVTLRRREMRLWTHMPFISSPGRLKRTFSIRQYWTDGVRVIGRNVVMLKPRSSLYSSKTQNANTQTRKAALCSKLKVFW